MSCSPPGSSVHGIFQARILEWVSISFSGVSSLPRDRTNVSCFARQILNPRRHQGSHTFYKIVQYREKRSVSDVGIKSWIYYAILDKFIPFIRWISIFIGLLGWCGVIYEKDVHSCVDAPPHKHTYIHNPALNYTCYCTENLENILT